MGAPQPVEKVAFACEAGICNPFFASALPRQKTLLSQQVCGLVAKPPRRARGWDVRQKSHFNDFLDGLKPPPSLRLGGGYLLCEITGAL